MKLNQTIRYAVLCLFELAKEPLEYFEAELLSRLLQIPSAYAQKVLQALAHAGLVIGLKGAGYKLARPLSHISALNVIEALSKDQARTQAFDASGLLEKRINLALDNCKLNEIQTSN